MTCVVGVKHGGRVWIGADSAGSNGYDITTRVDRKVFLVGDFVISGTTSFRMLQLLQFAFTPPKRHKDDDVMRFMVVDFIGAVRECLKSGGFARKDNDVESGGEFLVGYAGRLFRICSDYQVGESAHEYEACGCGRDYAIGALHAIGSSLLPDERIRVALRAAEEHSCRVRGAFHIESN